jgi:hypothetical protein
MYDSDTDGLVRPLPDFWGNLATPISLGAFYATSVEQDYSWKTSHFPPAEIVP